MQMYVRSAQNLYQMSQQIFDYSKYFIAICGSYFGLIIDNVRPPPLLPSGISCLRILVFEVIYSTCFFFVKWSNSNHVEFLWTSGTISLSVGVVCVFGWPIWCYAMIFEEHNRPNDIKQS